jgi:hypothetical protein
VALAGVAAAAIATGWNPTLYGGDAWNYLAAGERVAAGHSAYALTAGDRPVPIIPPYWTIPLLSPPAVLLVWTPLSRLGDASMTIWALANLVATVAACAWLLIGRTTTALAVIALLSPAIALLALSGNVNGFVLLGLVGVWVYRDEPIAAGTILGLVILAKLTPIFLVLWLISTRRWRALTVAAATASLVALATLALVGVDPILVWIRAAPEAQPSPLALASLANVSPVTVVVALTAGVAVVASTRSDRWTWVAAIGAAAFATPAFYFQAIALLGACAAPWAGIGTPSAAGDPRPARFRRNPA